VAAGAVSLSSLEARLARIDARRRAEAPGQAALDLSGGGSGPGGGQQCGRGWIRPDYECHQGAGQAAAGGGEGAAPAAAAEKPDYSPAASKARARGGLQFSRGRQGRHTLFRYRFRDRDAAEHWLADDTAKSGADLDAGPYDRRRQEWQQAYAKEYREWRETYAGMNDRQLHEHVESMAMAGKATRGGTAVDVKIGSGSNAAASPPPETGPSRPARPAEPLTAQTAATPQQQAQLARQQQQAAAQAGDRRGQQAWRDQERSIERQRVAAAMAAAQQTQTGLFGATEFDETLPLFRRDGDPTSSLLTAAIAEQLPGAQVLNWERPRPGVHAGRVEAEGLVYRFRTDSAGIAYRPAWEGLNEREWEARSTGFMAARTPGRRGDARRVNFEQRQGKRQCSIGYSCGRSCIAMAKECQVTPSSAIGKQRLKALEALAREGRPEAAQKAAEVAAARGEKATELREQRNVGQLKKMLQDPQVAEMVRTGRVPTAEPARKSKVQDVSPDEIEVDAERFQYKLAASATGEVGSLAGVQRWDPNLAGVISVWEDPEDGRTYVVNGHNRLALAKRLGAEEITVRYLDAEDAQKARSIGAKQNIAEGHGTAIDAAKFFRDTGIATQQQVEESGLPLNSGTAAQGLALQALPDGMFQAVVQGDLSINRGAIIGGSGLGRDKQAEVYRVLKQNARMTDGTLREYVAAAYHSEAFRQTGIEDILGMQQVDDNLLERSKLSAGLRSKLRREQRLFGTVARARAAEALQSRGGNVINTEQSAQVSQEAGMVLGVFDRLKHSAGPVSDALNAAARRMKAGERESVVKAELEEAVIGGVRDELRRLGMLREERNPREELGASMFDSAAARLDALEARLVRLDKNCTTGRACGNSCVPADRQCAKPGAPSGPPPERPAAAEGLAKVGAAPDKSPNKSGREARGGGFVAAAREAGRSLARAIANSFGILTPGQKAEVKAQEAEAAEQRRQQRLAERQAEEKQILARGPRKWSVKKTREVSEGATTERGYQVQLEEPIRVQGRLTDSLRFDVVVEESNGRALRSEFEAAGLQLPSGSIDNAVEMSWGTGIGQASFLSSHRMELPPAIARRFAIEVSKGVKATVASMKDGQLVLISAYDEDGYGDKRKSLYERSGFTFLGSGVGVAVVRDGRLTRLASGRGDRRDAAEEIDLERLIFELMQLQGPGTAMDSAARLDALEARLARLDASRRQSPGQMALDLSGAGTGPNGGQQCGRGWIRPDYNCHQGAGQAAAAKREPPRKASREIKTSRDYLMRSELSLEGGGRPAVKAEVVTTASRYQKTISRAVFEGKGGDSTSRYAYTDERMALNQAVLALKSLAEENGITLNRSGDGEGDWVKIEAVTLAFQTGIGGEYETFSRASRLQKEDGALIARNVVRQFREQLRGLQDGTLLECSAYTGDNNGPARRKFYEALGFRGFESRVGAGLYAVVKDGKIIKPSKRADSEIDEAEPDEDDWMQWALMLPEFGGPYGDDDEQQDRPGHV
jgi:hypothetical protein